MAPLHSAAKRGDSELVKVALQHGGVDVNEVDENGNAALHLAAQYGHIDVVEQLIILSKGRLRDFRNFEGKTSADVAHANKHYALCRLLQAQFGDEEEDSPKKDEKPSLAMEPYHKGTVISNPALAMSLSQGGGGGGDSNRWSTVANNLKDELFRQTEKNYAIMREKEKALRDLSEIQQAFKHAGNYEHEAKVLREEKKQLLKKIDNLEQDEMALRQMAREREIEYKGTLSTLQEKTKSFERYDSQISKFQDKFNDASREKAEWQQREQTMRRELDDAKSAVRQLEDEAKGKDRKIDLHNTDASNLAEKVASLKEMVTKLEEENMSLGNKTKQAENALGMEAQQLTNVRQELERAREENAHNTNIVKNFMASDIKDEHERLKKQLTDALKELDALKIKSLQDLNEERSATTEAKRAFDSQKREFDRTTDSLERAISDHNDSKSYRKELEKELYDNRMKCEKLQLERQSLAIDHDREKNAAQLASLETKMYLERTQLDLKNVRETLAEQKALASKLQGEVEAARDKVYDYRLQVEKYSKEAAQHAEEARRALEKAEAIAGLNNRIGLMQRELEEVCARVEEETMLKNAAEVKLHDTASAKGKSEGDYERLRQDHLKSVTAAMEREKQAALHQVELKSKAAQLEGKLQTMEKEFDLTATKLKQSQETYWHQNDQIASLTSDLKDANKELGSHATTLSKASMERETAEGESERRNRELLDKLQEATAALDENKETLSQTESTVEALNAEITELTSSNVWLKDKAHLLEYKQLEAQQKAAALHVELVKVQTAKDEDAASFKIEVANIHKIKEDHVASFKTEVANNKTTKEKDVADFKMEVANIKTAKEEEIAKIQAAKETAVATIKSEAAYIKTVMDEEVASMKKEVANIKTAKEEEVANMKTAKDEEVANMKRAKEEVEAKLKEVSDTMEAKLKAAIDTMEETIKTRQGAVVQELREQFKEESKKAEKLRKELERENRALLINVQEFDFKINNLLKAQESESYTSTALVHTDNGPLLDSMREQVYELQQDLRAAEMEVAHLGLQLVRVEMDRSEAETRLKIIRTELEVERKQRINLEVAFTQLASETEGGSQGVDLLEFKQQVTFAENAMVAAKGEMLTLIAAGASDDAVRSQKSEAERMEDVYHDAKASLESAEDVYKKLEESGISMVEMVRLAYDEIEDLKERLNTALTEQAEQAAVMFASMQITTENETSPWGSFWGGKKEGATPVQIEAARLTAELEKEKKKMRLQAEETKEQIALNMAIEIEEERLFLQEKMELEKRKMRTGFDDAMRGTPLALDY